MRSLIDTGGGYHLRAPNLTSDHSHPFHPVFICSALNPVVQNNQQNKIRYTFEIFNCDEVFDILVLEKRIRIPADCVISSSKELGKCAYCKWHDSFSHNTCDCNVFR
jgi:hypothetical protein